LDSDKCQTCYEYNRNKYLHGGGYVASGDAANKWQKEIKSTADRKTEEVKFITRIEYSSVVGDTCYSRISIRLLGLFIQITYQVTERAVKSARGMLDKSNWSRLSFQQLS
jgi:hypothetical protein